MIFFAKLVKNLDCDVLTLLGGIIVGDIILDVINLLVHENGCAGFSVE